MKRCGKSAPRVRQRKRHGKPHREQDRIGAASRERSPQGDNTAGRCQARRPGRLLEATCKRCPRGMAVTYRPRNRAVPYKTRLTGWLISCVATLLAKSSSVSRQERHILPKMRGSAPTRRTPRHFLLTLFLLEGVIPGRERSDRTRNLEIPRCAIAHLWSGPSDHPGMTSLIASLRSR